MLDQNQDASDIQPVPAEPEENDLNIEREQGKQEIAKESKFIATDISHIRFISKQQLKTILKYGLAAIPAAIDGLGYGVLTLSELLTMLYSMRLMEQNPEKLKEFDTLIPLLIMPTLAGIGIAALDTWENKEFIEEHFMPEKKEPPTWRAQLEKVINFVRNHPGLAIILFVGSTVDGIIVQSNVGYLTNQFGTHFEESAIYKPSIVICSIIGAQFFLVNGPSLVELVEEGYTLKEDYTQHIYNRFGRGLARAVVNSLPIISAFTTGALGGSESYQYVQYRIAQFQPEDLANRLAIIPAATLGIFAFTCHFGLYGRRYKLVLAQQVRDLTKQGVTHYFLGLFVPEETKGSYIAKVVFVYTTGVLIAATSFIVGYGAQDEMAYIIKYGEPPAGPLDDYQTPEFLPFYWKVLLFSVPAVIYGHESYATESGSLFKLMKVWKHVQEEAANHNVVIVEIANSRYAYTLEKLLTDTAIIAFVGGMKFIGDWYYIPDEVTPNEMRIRNTLTSAAMAGVGSVAITLAAKVADSFKDKDQRDNPQNLPAVSHPGLRYARKVLLMYAITTSTMVLTELAFRYLLLNQTKGEEENRLDDAQVMGAFAGGVATAITLRTWDWASDKVSNLGQSCVSFFKRQPSVKAANVVLNVGAAANSSNASGTTLPVPISDKSPLLTPFLRKEPPRRSKNYHSFNTSSVNNNSNSSWSKAEVKEMLNQVKKHNPH